MVKGYLMGSRRLFEKWDNDNNYHIFIPETGKILGYFKNKKLDFSKEKFYEDVDLKKFKILNAKISKSRFVKVIELEEISLSLLESSTKDLKRIKEKLNEDYKRLDVYFNYIKSQK